MLALHTGSLPLPRWTRGLLSVPWRPGTPTYRLQVKTRRRACYHALPHAPQLQTSPPYRGSGVAMCHVAPDSTSPLRRSPALPCIPRLQTLPRCQEGLRCYHMFHSSRHWLPTEEGSDAAMCSTTLDTASLLGGLQCCHMSCGSLWAACLKHKGSHCWFNRAFKARTFSRRTHMLVL
jgi:hypothetical protein